MAPLNHKIGRPTISDWTMGQNPYIYTERIKNFKRENWWALLLEPIKKTRVTLGRPRKFYRQNNRNGFALDVWTRIAFPAFDQGKFSSNKMKRHKYSIQYDSFKMATTMSLDLLAPRNHDTHKDPLPGDDE